jgi:glutathione S-transferase
VPKSLISGFEELPNFSKWAAEVIRHDSVLYVFDEDALIAAARKRFAKAGTDSK